MKRHVICPICTSKQLSFLFYAKDRMFQIPGTFRIAQCPHCHLVMLAPQPSAQVLARHYPSQKYYSYANRSAGFFSRMREYLFLHHYLPTIRSRLVNLIVGEVPALPHQRPPGKLLDIGCGAGDTLLSLERLGWEVYGLEIDIQAVKTAHKRGLRNVTLGGYTDLTRYPNDYFDVIRLYHVIEHLDKPDKALSLIKKKLKPGGELIMGTPNVASIVSRIFGMYWYNLDTPRHLYLFSPKTLSTIVAQVGLTVTSIQFCSAGGWVGSLQYVLGEKLGLQTDLIHRTWIVFLLYPLEWMIDRIGLGDVFVLRARI